MDMVQDLRLNIRAILHSSLPCAGKRTMLLRLNQQLHSLTTFSAGNSTSSHTLRSEEKVELQKLQSEVTTFLDETNDCC